MSEKPGTDPSVLSDGQLMHLAASVMEAHASMIFVDDEAGARFIAELRKRAGDMPPPGKIDLPPGGDA